MEEETHKFALQLTLLGVAATCCMVCILATVQRVPSISSHAVAYFFWCGVKVAVFCHLENRGTYFVNRCSSTRCR